MKQFNPLQFCLLVFAILLGTTNQSFGQIGINSTASPPAASAALDIDFPDKGVLIPRVELTSADAASPIASPSLSMLVYNTATAGAPPNNVSPGFYYWDGSAWVALLTGTGANTGWATTGNAGTSSTTNFIGTTDSEPLTFRTADTEQMTLDESGKLSIGTNIAEFKLNLDNDGGIIAKGIFGAGADLTTIGGGTRLMWSPKRGAFLAGGITGNQWDDVNIGNYSAAVGLNNQVSGSTAFAAGNENSSAGHFSFAFGNANTAGGFASFTGGESSLANGNYSFAVGN